MILHIVTFALAISVVLLGAKVLVDGAISLAKSFQVSPLIIGLTVVAFGTSTPELAVSVQSALTGHESLALSNVVGSNICNVLLILGLAALLIPLQVQSQVVRVDVPLLILISGIFWFFTSDGVLRSWEAAFFLAVFMGYIHWLMRNGSLADAASEVATENATAAASGVGPARVSRDASEPDVSAPNLSVVVQSWFSFFVQTRSGAGVLIFAGFILLVVSSSFAVNSAVQIAQILGIDEVIVGLTVVAIGTSLPELATTVVAALNKQKDIAVGNIIGSNMFNAMMITGVAGMVAPDGLTVSPGMVSFDIPFMVLTTFLCLPIFLKGFNIDRVEGLLFLGLYVAYNSYLGMRAFGHHHFDNYHQVLVETALPLIVAVVIFEAGRYYLKNRRRA